MGNVPPKCVNCIHHKKKGVTKMKPSKCVYYKKMRKKGYTRCLRDNSIRNGACPCPFYEQKFFGKIKEKIEDKFFDWLWRIKYVRK